MRLFTNKRGSAIIMALVTMTILLVLGMAVITLSLGTLTTNVADATTNDTYYAAEAGINSAIEQVKTEVVRYYAEMSKLDGNYTSLYDGFFSGIASNSSSNFDEPFKINNQNIGTITTFSAGNINADDNTGDILISCEAIAADGTKYAVNGSVNVLRIDLRSSGEWFKDNLVLHTGGNLNLEPNFGMTANGADIILGSLTLRSDRSWALGHNGSLSTNLLEGDSISDILSFSPPTLTNPYVVTQSMTYSSPPAQYVTTLDNVDLTFTNNVIPESTVIYGRGNVTLERGGNVYGDIYCQGDFVNYGRAIYGNVYCNGSINLIGGDVYGSLYAKGPISIGTQQAGVGGQAGVIYSSTQLNFGGFNIKGIFFSGGDVVITGNGGPTITGMLIAKNNIRFNSYAWMTVTYDQSYIDQVKANNPFFFPSSGSGGSGGGGGNTPTSDVIQGQTITAVGRIN